MQLVRAIIYLVARICLSHTAFRNNNEVVVGKWDGTIEEYNFVKD